jgi:uncharacterized protein (DUF488 family)
VSGEFIYTLGTSDRTPDEFLALLKDVGVEVVVDVRRFPTSRFKHFEKDELSRLLERGGFYYIYLGKELGGYRRKGYEAYVGTEEFRQGLSRLKELVCKSRVVILCAERLPWRCHRRFIGQELERDGFKVVHVIDEKRTWVSRSKFEEDS